jgi:hypothetical protein
MAFYGQVERPLLPVMRAILPNIRWLNKPGSEKPSHAGLCSLSKPTLAGTSPNPRDPSSARPTQARRSPGDVPAADGAVPTATAPSADIAVPGGRRGSPSGLPAADRENRAADSELPAPAAAARAAQFLAADAELPAIDSKAPYASPITEVRLYSLSRATLWTFRALKSARSVNSRRRGRVLWRMADHGVSVMADGWPQA